MILKQIDSQLFNFKGYSTVYKCLRHFSDNRSRVQCINTGTSIVVPSDKLVELVPLETL